METENDDTFYDSLCQRSEYGPVPSLLQARQLSAFRGLRAPGARRTPDGATRFTGPPVSFMEQGAWEFDRLPAGAVRGNGQIH